MKNIINFKLQKVLSGIVFFLMMIMFSSCKKEELNPISSIGVSQGVYLNIIHLSWDPVEDATHYNIERQGPDGEWRPAGTVSNSPFDDYGFSLPDNKLVEGVKYNYRIISGSSDIGDSQPAYAQNQGWTYIVKPIDLSITREGPTSIILQWTDPNQDVYDTYGNQLEYYYKIERKYKGDTDFVRIHTTDHGGGEQTYEDKFLDKDKKVIYRITGVYEYQYKNMDDDYMTRFFYKTFDPVEEPGGGDVPESNYTIENLNNLTQSADGYGFVSLKSIQNTMYLATIPKPAFGAPVVYKLNGTNWQNISGNYPDGLQNNFDRISICGYETTLWVAGVSDSAYIYGFDGNWSSNLAFDNMGMENRPDNILIEYHNNNLYALVEHGSRLDLLVKDQNNSWSMESTLEDNASVFDLGLREVNGTLYTYYSVFNSENNSTVKIKHQVGSSWQSDFEKAYDNVMGIQVAVKNNGDIYFTSNSQDPATWVGNVFKVTSPGTAEEMVSASNTWLTFPQCIALDNVGNPMVLYGKFVSASEPAEMHLAVYENNEWKIVSGDFSHHINPAVIESDQGIYFAYGDGTNVNTNGYPTVLKVDKFTK